MRNDLPAIIGSAAFAQMSRALGGAGPPADQAEVEHALHAENDRQSVRLAVTTPKPDDAVAIAQTAVSLIQTNGLRYWGDMQATPAAPGLNVAVLDIPPTQAVALNSPALDGARWRCAGCWGCSRALGWRSSYTIPRIIRAPRRSRRARCPAHSTLRPERYRSIYTTRHKDRGLVTWALW